LVHNSCIVLITSATTTTPSFGYVFPVSQLLHWQNIVEAVCPTRALLLAAFPTPENSSTFADRSVEGMSATQQVAFKSSAAQVSSINVGFPAKFKRINRQRSEPHHSYFDVIYRSKFKYKHIIFHLLILLSGVLITK
jgi:hypothetical protein